MICVIKKKFLVSLQASVFNLVGGQKRERSDGRQRRSGSRNCNDLSAQAPN